MLDDPSLAERLPNGLIGVNDDYRHRVVLIDPQRRRIVWQYGHTDHSGRRPGYRSPRRLRSPRPRQHDAYTPLNGLRSGLQRPRQGPEAAGLTTRVRFTLHTIEPRPVWSWMGSGNNERPGSPGLW